MSSRTRSRSPRNLDQLTTSLAGAANGLAHRTEVILALTSLGVMLAPHTAASSTLGYLTGSATPAADAVALIDGGLAVTPHLWGHYAPLRAAVQDAVDNAAEQPVGRLAELLAGADLDQHCGDEARYGPDLLGALYSRLRGSAGRAAGAVYTPAPLALLMAMMATPTENSTVCDPAVGSGILLWAAATAMRRSDLDPRTCVWFGVDTDPLAVAIAAVNTATWNLHDVTVLHCGNGLTATPAHLLDSNRTRLAAGARRYLADQGGGDTGRTGPAARTLAPASAAAVSDHPNERGKAARPAVTSPAPAGAAPAAGSTR